MEKFVCIDMSKAYLLALMASEARTIKNDDFLDENRRTCALVLYGEVGRDFNEFFVALKEFTRHGVAVVAPQNMKECLAAVERDWYKDSVHALKVFKNNLDKIWCWAYGDKTIKLVGLTR